MKKFILVVLAACGSQATLSQTEDLSATAQAVEASSYVTLTGTIEHLNLFGPGGEAPPSGAYLVLPRAIRVDDKKFDRVFLGLNPVTFAESATLVRLHGKLNLHSYGHVEVRDGKFLTLSGVSNLSAGEPAFENGRFIDENGAELVHAELRGHPDAPSTLLMHDETKDVVFFATNGGFVALDGTSFSGVLASAPVLRIETEATQEIITELHHGERYFLCPLRAVERDECSSLKAMQTVGEDTAHYADQMFNNWFLDTTNGKLILAQSGGIAGFQNLIVATVELPEALR